MCVSPFRKRRTNEGSSSIHLGQNVPPENCSYRERLSFVIKPTSRADTLSVTVSSSITYVFPPKPKMISSDEKETQECSHFCSPITLKQEMKLCCRTMIFDVPFLIVAQFLPSVKRNTDEQFLLLSTSASPFK